MTIRTSPSLSPTYVYQITICTVQVKCWLRVTNSVETSSMKQYSTNVIYGLTKMRAYQVKWESHLSMAMIQSACYGVNNFSLSHRRNLKEQMNSCVNICVFNYSDVPYTHKCHVFPLNIPMFSSPWQSAV